MNETYFINDKRSLECMKIKTFSGYKKNDVIKMVLKCIDSGKIEEACHWTTECLLSGYTFTLWEKLLIYGCSVIHINNPNLPCYLVRKNMVLYNQVKRLNAKKIKDIVLLIRNSQMVRNLFIDVVTTLATSSKKKRYDKYPKINKQEDFQFHNIQKRLCAPMNILPSHIIHFNDPDELKIIMNEIFTMLKNKQFGYDRACYWMMWLIEWDTLHKKKKNNLYIDERNVPEINKKYRNNIVWILWEIIEEEMNLRNESQITKQIKDLKQLYLFEFTIGKRNIRLPYLFYAVGYLTHTINFKIPIRLSYPIFIQVQGNINKLFLQKKMFEQNDIIVQPKEKPKKKKKDVSVEIVQDKISIFNEIDSLIMK